MRSLASTMAPMAVLLSTLVGAPVLAQGPIATRVNASHQTTMGTTPICYNTQSSPSPTATLFTECYATDAVGIGGGSSARTNFGPDQEIFATSFLVNNNTNPLTWKAGADAEISSWVTLDGPVDQIFRAFVVSDAGLYTTAAPRTLGNASVQLFLRIATDNAGHTLQGATSGLFSDPTVAITETSLSAAISGASLQLTHSFFFGLSASAFVDQSSQGFGMWQAEAAFPEIFLYDAGGNDISAQFDFSYSNTFTPYVAPPPVTATPEPASIALMATGLAGLGGFARRRNRRSRVV